MGANHPTGVRWLGKLCEASPGQAIQNSLLVTLYYTAGVVFITTVLSLGLAVLLQRSWRFRSILRISYFVPLVIPLFIAGALGTTPLISPLVLYPK